MIRHILFKYDLGQKYSVHQDQPELGSNSWSPDHDSTFHVTETPALTTWPSVTSSQRVTRRDMNYFTTVSHYFNKHPHWSVAQYHDPLQVSLEDQNYQNYISWTICTGNCQLFVYFLICFPCMSCIVHVHVLYQIVNKEWYYYYYSYLQKRPL